MTDQETRFKELRGRLTIGFRAVNAQITHMPTMTSITVSEGPNHTLAIRAALAAYDALDEDSDATRTAAVIPIRSAHRLSR